MNILRYKGYLGSAEISLEDKVIFGKLLYVNDLVTYEADSVDEIQKSFEEAVDDYIQYCEESGKEPEKSFNGVFNVRVSPDLHKKAVYKAAGLGVSLNQFVEQAIYEKVYDTSVAQEHAEISKKVDNLNSAMMILNNNMAIGNNIEKILYTKGAR